VAESQCALLGKSTNVLIAIEGPVWLTGRERQQKAGHCDHPSERRIVFPDDLRQHLEKANVYYERPETKKSARSIITARGLLKFAGCGRRRSKILTSDLWP
jgi:hypothetical protein